MLPEVNSRSGGNKEAISLQAARLLSAATSGPPSGSVGVVVSQERGGPVPCLMALGLLQAGPQRCFVCTVPVLQGDLFCFAHGGGLACLPVDLFLPAGTFDGNFSQVSGVSEVTEGFVKLSSAVRKLYSVLLRGKWAELNYYTFWTCAATEELQHMTDFICCGCDGGYGAAGAAAAASAKGVGIRSTAP